MKRASLGTLFLTVFLDLLGFGLVVPFLPGVARALGASDAVAPLLGAVYSLMQFLFIPVWGRLSDRVGRRPVLLVSIAASAVGMASLGFAGTLPLLFAARVFSGVATSNIAVAQAYIADVTAPSERARGMGVIGVAFGMGFIFGPFLGGELGRFVVFGHAGAAAAFAASGLSLLNLALALRYLPESLPPERRGVDVRHGSPFDLSRLRAAFALPGVGVALGVNFIVVLSFAGMEQTFRLFTADAFGMGDAGTGRVLGVVGVIAAIVQGGAIRPLSRRYGETRLVQAGVLLQVVAFAMLAASPGFARGPVAMLFAASGVLALGSGLTSPSLSSYVSRRGTATAQGATLGVLQSLSALGRVAGPTIAGTVYGWLGPSATYYGAALGMAAGAALTLGLETTSPSLTAEAPVAGH